MASFLFKSVMLVLLISYVCSGYIANAKNPELSDKTIVILETFVVETVFNSALGMNVMSEPATVIKETCLAECQETKIPEHLIEFCMENCNVRLTTKLEQDGFNALMAELA